LALEEDVEFVGGRALAVDVIVTALFLLFHEQYALGQLAVFKKRKSWYFLQFLYCFPKFRPERMLKPVHNHIPLQYQQSRPLNRKTRIRMHFRPGPDFRPILFPRTYIPFNLILFELLLRVG
jgi:hypothetical protein